MSPSEPATLGVHHVGLAVPDVATTAAFFVEALGFRVVGERPSYPAIFVSDGCTRLTLWQLEDPTRAVGFDRRRNVGLHHLALRVADRAALHALHARLSARGDVVVEFPPEALGAGPTEHLMCLIPGGLRLELIAPVEG